MYPSLEQMAEGFERDKANLLIKMRQRALDSPFMSGMMAVKGVGAGKSKESTPALTPLTQVKPPSEGMSHTAIKTQYMQQLSNFEDIPWNAIKEKRSS